MNDEKLFELAVQLTIAKMRAHFISPGLKGADDWIDDQISQTWNQLRELWRNGHKQDNVHPM